MNGNVQIMNKIIKDNIDHFNLLRKIGNKDKKSQRELAKDLGFSWKTELLLKRITKKGLIKIKNFKKNPNKLNYLYYLTPKGITTKTSLTISFMKRKMREYEELKMEIEDK